MVQQINTILKVNLAKVLTLSALLLSAVPCSAIPESDEVIGYLKNRSYLIKQDNGVLDPDIIQKTDSASLNQMLNTYDKYARYTDSLTFSTLKNLAVTKTAGVGMDLIYDKSGNIRCIPYKGSPADNNGIEYKDILLEVDFMDITNSPLDEVAELIRGKENSTVEIKVEKSDGSIVALEIKRASGSYAEIEKTSSDPETIKIYRFAKGTSELLEKYLKSLKSSPDKRIFIDLRGNTGGVLEEGAKCAGFFLPRGEILYSIKNKNEIKKIQNEVSGICKDRKVIILMDDLTASAAELMICAMKNSPTVGTYGVDSAGKSYIQDVFPLEDGAVIKFTTGELLYKDKDYGWEGKGISPDIVQR